MSEAKVFLIPAHCRNLARTGRVWTYEQVVVLAGDGYVFAQAWKVSWLWAFVFFILVLLVPFCGSKGQTTAY